jgi:GNAT superfamily N-acetyltransferase
MTDPLLAVQLESMREFQRGFGRAARDGGVIELPGAVACLTPGFGTHSLFNAAVFEAGADLPALLAELEAIYDDAGVSAWGAWTHESDAAATRAFAAHGLVLDSTPTAMVRALDGSFEPRAEVDVARCDDIASLAAVSAAAWGFPAETAVHAQPGILESFNVYLARDERGEPGCVVGTVHHRGDCGVTLVGTAPPARGRGLATAAMLFALAEAQRAGCTTTTLQATVAGRPIYARLGYRELGAMQLWEQRRTQSAAARE